VLIYFYRISLVSVSSPDSFGSLDRFGNPYTREAWLREYFSQTRTFTHRGNEFAFVPEAETKAPRNLIIGWIARPKLLSERTPPSMGFEPTEHSSWRGSLIIIDPSSHEDGQKIAMEYRTDVGKPTPVLVTLAAEMRIGEHPRPFDVQIHPIVEASSFWKFAEAHDFQIDLITFDSATPNMFSGSDEYSKALRKVRNENRVSRVRSTLVSDTTIDVQRENIMEIVEYNERGAGDIRARTKSRKYYNSKNHVRHERVETEQGSENFWVKIIDWLGQRF